MDVCIYIYIYCNIYNIYHIFIIIYVNKKATPNNDQKSIPKDVLVKMIMYDNVRIGL